MDICEIEKKSNILWGEKYQPTCREELIWSPSKIEEMMNGLTKANVIRLQGPSGSAKRSSTIVLTKTLGYQLCEWHPPPFSTDHESLQKQFFKFLTCKYTQLTAPNGMKKIRQVRLIKDIPYTLYKPNSLSWTSCVEVTETLLKTFCSMEQKRDIVLVFILGDHTEDHRLSRRLFSCVLHDLYFVDIKVKSPTTRMLQHIWKHISQNERNIETGIIKRKNGFVNDTDCSKKKSVKSEKVANIPNLKYWNHNLNEFLLKIQFPNLLGDFKNSVPIDSTTFHDLHDDSGQEIMHVIARLLWNKRVDRREKDLPKKYLPPLSPAQRLQLATYPSYIQTNVSNLLESSSLTCRQMSFEEMSPKIFRPPLYYNVDDLLESVFHDYTTVISLLYTNYLFFFGHITDAAQLIHTFSYADAYFKTCLATYFLICGKEIVNTNLHPIPPSSAFLRKNHSQQPNCEKQNAKSFFFLQPAYKLNVKKNKSSFLQTFTESNILPHYDMLNLRTFPLTYLIDVFQYYLLCYPTRDLTHNVCPNSSKESLQQTFTSSTLTVHSTSSLKTFDHDCEESDIFVISEQDLDPEDDIENIDFLQM